MDDRIKNLILEKAINRHYAIRYIRFIEVFDRTGGSIKHHILPKAKDFWPEFSNLKENEWNCSILTNRQHFIAHCLLCKALGGSQTIALWRMGGKTSRLYQSLREHYSKENSTFMKSFYENKNGKAIRSLENKKRVEQKTHNWLKRKEDDPVYFEKREAKRKQAVLEKHGKEPLLQSRIDFLKKKMVENVSQLEIVKNKKRETDKMKANRDCVIKIKLYHQKFGMKLGQSWWKKSDEFLNEVLQKYIEMYGEL